MTDELVVKVVLAAFGAIGGGAVVKAVTSRTSKRAGAERAVSCEAEKHILRHEGDEREFFADLLQQMRADAANTSNLAEYIKRMDLDAREARRDMREAMKEVKVNVDYTRHELAKPMQEAVSHLGVAALQISRVAANVDDVLRRKDKVQS